MRPREPVSACLLFNDDNHMLIEWLAYHYYAVGLRSVVVAVDPMSHESPKDILDRWRPWLDNVAVWDDPDYGFEPDTAKVNGTIADKTNVHRSRQPFFYRKCTEYLKSLDQTITLYHDVDEFIAINEEVIPDAQNRMSRPNGVLDLLSELQSSREDDYYRTPCLLLPRLLFSAVESDAGQVRNGVPSLFDASRFMTLRWRHHNALRDKKNNGQPKSMMNVQLADPAKHVFHTHRVVEELCPRRKGHRQEIGRAHV